MENREVDTDKLERRPTDTAMTDIPDDMIRDAGKGTEEIGSDDVRPPRLLLCQSGSPQRKPDDPKQIAGLQELDMFNDLSGEIYGRGPLKFTVIRSLGSRHIQFAPIDEGGGVIDFDVPADDPRTQFTTNDEGERVKPVATKFYDYLVWLVDQQEMVALSMKSSQIKTAIKLNGLMKLPLKIGERILANPPAWARTFSLETKMDKDKNYSWGSFNLKQVGTTPEEVRQMCSTLAEIYKRKNIVIEREDDPIDDEPVAGNSQRTEPDM